MRYIDNGYALFSVKALHHRKHVTPAKGIEHSCGLVENYHLGLHSNYSRNGNSLLLTARKLMRRVLAVLCHIYKPKRIVNAAPYLRPFKPEIFGAECNVLLNNGCNKLIIGILKYHTDLAPDVKKIVLAEIFIGYISAVDIYFSNGWREDHIQKLGER